MVKFALCKNSQAKIVSYKYIIFAWYWEKSDTGQIVSVAFVLQVFPCKDWLLADYSYYLSHLINE